MATSECSFGSGLGPWGLLPYPREERSRMEGSAETRREWGIWTGGSGKAIFNTWRLSGEERTGLFCAGPHMSPREPQIVS